MTNLRGPGSTSFNSTFPTTVRPVSCMEPVLSRSVFLFEGGTAIFLAFLPRKVRRSIYKLCAKIAALSLT
jgi:hypothetical protein